MVTALIVLCIWAQADQEREVEYETVETESEKGVRRWHKLTFIIYPQIIMIFSAPRPYLQMRYAEVQIIGDRFVCNVFYLDNMSAWFYSFILFSFKSSSLTLSVAAPIFIKYWVFPLLEWPLLLFNWVFSFDLGLPEALWPEDGRLTAVDVDCLLCPLKMLTDSVRIVHTFLNILWSRKTSHYTVLLPSSNWLKQTFPIISCHTLHCFNFPDSKCLCNHHATFIILVESRPHGMSAH